jgi:hypothetical protein
LAKKGIEVLLDLGFKKEYISKKMNLSLKDNQRNFKG